jgi:hypothetical protein
MVATSRIFFGARLVRKPTAEASAGADVAESVERRVGAKGNTHQHSTH